MSALLVDRVQLRPAIRFGRIVHRKLNQVAGPTNLLVALAAMLCYELKRFYQSAGPEELRWILAPTRWFAELWTGVDFIYEAGFGYVSLGERFVIAPECAGINFLVVLFASLVLATRLRSELRVATLVLAASTAFVVTVLVNSARIALSLSHPEVLALSPADSHRVLGIVVFCGSLLVTHAVWNRWALRAHGSTLLPSVLVYLFVTLGVPFLRGVRGHEFVHHLAWTLGITTLLWILVALVRNVVGGEHAHRNLPEFFRARCDRLWLRRAEARNKTHAGSFPIRF